MIQAFLIRIVALLVWCGCATWWLHAQPAGANPSVSERPSLPGVSLEDKVQPPPPLPGSQTKAEMFRELLEMSPIDRAQALSDRSESQRRTLERSLAEYDSLTPAQREARLRQLELTCHLERLMTLAPERRAERLAAVPADLRPLVDRRLQQWDRVPAHIQQQVLEHDTTANYFLRVRPAQAGERDSNPPLTASPEAGSETSARVAQPFSAFFRLPPKEQQRTLMALPPGEREEMERTLKKFASLPPEQRKICIDSFEKFSRMSKAQRDQFLKSAARWSAMSPKERETWRALVSILPPGPPVMPPPLPGTPGPAGTVTASNATALPNASR